jgi:hypothetical protein
MFVFVGLFIALPGLLKYADDQAKQKAYENLPDGHRLMCNIPSELEMIFDRMNDISSDNFDNKAKGIYQSILWGNDIESCDVLYMYNQLDDVQKQKLDWLELSCTVNHCMP